LSAPVRSARGIRQLEVLDPHHEDDIVPVILKEPDHHGALAVTLHVGHRFGHVEWGADPAHRYSVGDPGREIFHLVNLAWVSPPTTLAASGTYSHVQSLMR